MSTFAIINLGSHGHVNPTLSTAEELVARGHEVHYFSTEPFAAAIEVTGATFHAYESHMGKDVPSATKMADLIPIFPLRLLREAAFSMPQIIARVEALRPDVVLYDPICLVGRLVAEALAIPAVQLHATYAANEHFSLRRDILRVSATDKIVGDFNQLAQELSRTYGIQPPALANTLDAPEPFNIVYMPQSFHPQSELFDHRHLFVGPGFTTRPTSGRWTPTSVSRERRLFLSMGTVFNDWPEFFKMCIEAFGGTDFEVYMALGQRVDAGVLGPIPANIHVAAHLPQLDILPHTAAAIVHGGMGTTMEALSAGVPLLVIPQMPEQNMTARRVAELGLGMMLSREETTARSLVESVRMVTGDPSILANVAAMRAQLSPDRNLPGFMRAAAAIEDYTQRSKGNRRATKAEAPSHIL